MFIWPLLTMLHCFCFSCFPAFGFRSSADLGNISESYKEFPLLRQVVSLSSSGFLLCPPPLSWFFCEAPCAFRLWKVSPPVTPGAIEWIRHVDPSGAICCWALRGLLSWRVKVCREECPPKYLEKCSLSTLLWSPLPLWNEMKAR